MSICNGMLAPRKSFLGSNDDTYFQQFAEDTLDILLIRKVHVNMFVPDCV